MPILDYFKEKRGLTTAISAILLIVVVYFVVRYGTSTLFQGNIGADSEEPPPINFDVPGVEEPEEETDVPPTPEVTGFEAETPEEPPAENPEEPPEETPQTPENPPQENPQNPEIEIKIVDHSVSPKGFNPLISQTKIEYEISTEAKIEIVITDESGDDIVTLVDDEILDEGDHDVYWNGTDSTTNDGDVVDPGKYFYKIKAKDPDSSDIKDSESGSINAVYAVVNEDFENIPPGQTTTIPTTNTVTNQSAATVAVQNATSGQTVGTGPGVLMYAFLPLAGYFLTRRKNARK